MTELELWNAYKKIECRYSQIKLNNGKVVQGYPVIFTKAIDNDPEVAEIDIEDKTGQLHGYLQTEIEAIEVLE